MFQEKRIREAIRSLIEAVGEDPAREGLRDTPNRVSEMYHALFSGLGQNASEVLAASFEEDHQEMVILKDITFYSIC